MAIAITTLLEIVLAGFLLSHPLNHLCWTFARFNQYRYTLWMEIIDRNSSLRIPDGYLSSRSLDWDPSLSNFDGDPSLWYLPQKSLGLFYNVCLVRALYHLFISVLFCPVWAWLHEHPGVLCSLSWCVRVVALCLVWHSVLCMCLVRV